MSFPAIESCLICDDVRTEIGEKVSLMGFYGITPNVELLVQSFDRTIRLVYFLIGAGGDQGQYKLSLEVTGDNVAGPPSRTEFPLNLPKNSTKSQFAFELPTKFGGPGQYSFFLTVDGQLHFRTNFLVRQQS
jgi:hypothetical protein